MKTFILTGPDGKPYASPAPGALGGNRRSRVYGLMNCRAAARALAAGAYRKNRVFFADEATALAADYRPCGVCLPGRAKALAGAPGRD